jgi:hypothetical protein
LIDSSEIADLLNHLATSFEKVAEPPTDQKDAPNDSHGWGQFLDAAKPHKQVGLYGTSAGILVLALAQRGNDIGSTQAGKLLEYWWKSRSDRSGYSYQKLVQTPRLAFLNLALRLSGVPTMGVVAHEVEEALLEMRLPSGLWSNYWISALDHDPSPRLFPSALALLSFSLLKSDPTRQDPRLSGAAEALEAALKAKRDLLHIRKQPLQPPYSAPKGVR